MKKIQARFFQSESGNEPVREWLQGLSDAEKKKIGEDIATAEYGWPIGMPTCRALKKGLHEIRTQLPKKWARVLFFVKDQYMILVHGFMKKTNTTPKSDFDLALKRKKEYERNG